MFIEWSRDFMNILDIFYKNIVPEATSGRINCLMYYNIAFSTNVVEENKFYSFNCGDNDLLVPTLVINNKEEFDSLLLQYVDLASKFYDDSNFDNEILNYKIYNDETRICKEKVILALLFANATMEDFNNPVDFLRKRINFIYNDLTGSYDFGYCESLKGKLLLTVEKDIINNETPYQMVIRVISDKMEEFVFPRIKFGVSDNDVYIYAIQNKRNEENSFCKKINRVIYRVGEGYNDDNQNEESLKDITASFLLSLNIGISFLFNMGYTKIVVPSILVSRWNAKKLSNLLKIRIKNYDCNMASDMDIHQDYLQYNLTNKLIRTFLRLGCHYSNIDILSFPYEIDSCLHIGINDNSVKCNNSLLYETYKLVESGFKENTRHK